MSPLRRDQVAILVYRPTLGICRRAVGYGRLLSGDDGASGAPAGDPH
ncbi:MAG: hypothetical protein OXN90_19505 [Gemmatimonadota bacterium]|nr:hypothetical protein [Gemmatimonadota bacterium]